MNCQAYPSADVGSDHQLLILNLWLDLKKRESLVCGRKFDIKKLKDPVAIEAYRVHQRYRRLHERHDGAVGSTLGFESRIQRSRLGRECCVEALASHCVTAVSKLLTLN